MIIARERDTVIRARRAEAEFRDFVGDAAFPCLAGRGVVNSDQFTLGIYGSLGSVRSTHMLARDLGAFVAGASTSNPTLEAFVAVYSATRVASEEAFEHRLWTGLQRLHDIDDPATGWDPGASADPDAPDFAFSFAGRALFVIGLHPMSSRVARRFRWPTMVFNPHAQFERLRADGRFDRLQSAVREREIALQGSLNPNLADFGERSEARQYSGRAVEPEWRCPFRHRAR